jgi:hypothetical protein
MVAKPARILDLLYSSRASRERRRMSLGHAPLKRDPSGQAINLRAKRERSRLPDKEPAPARAGALRPSWFSLNWNSPESAANSILTRAHYATAPMVSFDHFPQLSVPPVLEGKFVLICIGECPNSLIIR